MCARVCLWDVQLGRHDTCPSLYYNSPNEVATNPFRVGSPLGIQVSYK